MKKPTMAEMKTIQDKHPNFRDKKGKLYLVHCFSCNRENYAMNVSSGICTWCGWKENKKEVKSK